MTTSMERELEALGKFRMGKIIGGKWKIVQKLDEGGFGSVYKVQSLKDSKLFGALKIELSRPNEANHLKLETEVMKDLHAEGFRSHIPALYRSGKKNTYCYMILSLLGENLKRLKEKHFSKGMPLRTLTRLGIQTLYAIKTMHDRGYVHRDIKPGNFVLGYHSLPAFARFVYIIDFGLARAFAYAPPKHSPPGTRWLSRRARASLDFKGTWRFAAPSMHEEKEQGRKDDIWSFLYMLIDLYCELPWRTDDDEKTVETKKLNISDHDLMTRMPDEFKFIPKHLRTLDVYQRPDYYRIFLALDKVRVKSPSASFEDPYEWELRDTATANKSALRKLQPPPGYTRADAFFNWDPLLIGGPPTAADEEEIKIRRAARESNSRTPSSDNNDGSTGKQGVKRKSGKRNPRGGVVSPNPSSSRKKRDKRSSSEDSADFIPSCYLNVDIPKHYLIDGKEHYDQKEMQKSVIRVEWGRMADGRVPHDKRTTTTTTEGRESTEKITNESAEFCISKELTRDKISAQERTKSAEPMPRPVGGRPKERKTKSGPGKGGSTEAKRKDDQKDDKRSGSKTPVPLKDTRKMKKGSAEKKK